MLFELRVITTFLIQWKRLESRTLSSKEGGRGVGGDKRGSNRERWFREWIGQSYENAVGYCLYTMSFKENPFTAEPGSGPCPRYSNGSHSYRSNCRYRPCHWQDPIIPWADIVTWKRWQLPIHFSDVFISFRPYSNEITRPPDRANQFRRFSFIDATSTKKFRPARFLISLIRILHICYEVFLHFRKRKIISPPIIFELTKNLEKKKKRKRKKVISNVSPQLYSLVHANSFPTSPSFYRIRLQQLTTLSGK